MMDSLLIIYYTRIAKGPPQTVYLQAKIKKKEN